MSRAVLSRRNFLQSAGFSFAAVAGGCARAPAEHVVPYLEQPETAMPGLALHYATTCAGCSAGCGVLATVRDGRPVKLEGLPGHPLSAGRLCAAGQASLLGLYDSERLANPLVGGKVATWAEADAALLGSMGSARAAGRAARILASSEAAASPTTRRLMERLLQRFDDGRLVVYDPLSVSAIPAAHAATHGLAALPHYRFDGADVVVSFDADFLGTWISPVEFAAAQAARRRPDVAAADCWHLQVEPCMSLTGAKADRRLVVSQSALTAVMAALATRVAARAGRQFAGLRPDAGSVDPRLLDEAAERLWAARGRALVVCGSEQPQAQRLANLLNELTGAYGRTLELSRPSQQRLGNDAELATLLDELRHDRVGALIIAGVNPVYDLHDGGSWGEAIARVPGCVAVAERLDETARVAAVVCPPPHALESWDDLEPVAGLLCLRQPVTAPLGETRSLRASLAAWLGEPASDRELLRQYWGLRLREMRGRKDGFDAFWMQSLQRGWLEYPVEPRVHRPFSWPTADADAMVPRSAPAGSFELAATASVAMLDGRQGYNPWLLELPDPITKLTWDCAAAVSPAAAAALGVTTGDLVTLSVAPGGPGTRSIEAPVVVQPGQHDGTVAVSRGWGQVLSSRFAGLAPEWIGASPRPGPVGVNVAPLLAPRGAAERTTRILVRPTGERRELALTQTYDRLELPEKFAPRGYRVDVVRTMPAGDALASVATAADGVDLARRGLWAVPARDGPRWGMVIDLDACSGCGACIVACQVENNTPVVGRDEVRRRREMHWMRIDRYYLDSPGGVRVAHQPMTCHQCGHAPCETVCPVSATTHSRDGLNQQVYSRCIGTRFCMNNCPFKVRRFNWFDYRHDDASLNLVLNPEVTVRSRGVAEKCTFCVQRIQEARIEARRKGVPLADNDVVPACAQTCPRDAIAFGDLNDPTSRVHRLAGQRRSYTLLESLNIDPSIHYLAMLQRAAIPPSGRDDG